MLRGFASTIPRSTPTLFVPPSHTPLPAPPSPPHTTSPNTLTPPPPLHLLLLRPPQQHPNVVPRLPLVQHLAKHLHPRHHRAARRPQPHDLHFIPHLHHPPLAPPRHHRPPPADREHILYRHQKRLLHRPHRRRNVPVHRLQ